MSSEFYILIATAVTISFLHTLASPDHYLPFIALSKARGWSFARTVSWTIICGCGHVWSSVLLGLGGAAIGWSLSSVQWLQSVRGGLASWCLLSFGLLYTIWGLIKAKQNRRHKHFDMYDDGSMYVYEHKHGELVQPNERHAVTPWVMFIIFVLGPCEPMIPLLSYPAAKNSWLSITALIVVYTVVTLLTMLVMVWLGFYGVGFFTSAKWERYVHALGGIAILICGAGMVFLQW